MKRGATLLSNTNRASMVSPLVDVIFNLMITMFVFLMIYMAVATPPKENLLRFLRHQLPSAKIKSHYFSSIGVTGGSGNFTFLLADPGSKISLRYDEMEKHTFVVQEPHDKQTQEESYDENILYRRGIANLKLHTRDGLLKADFLPGALGAAKEAQPVDFDVVVIDNARLRSIPLKQAEQWGDICLGFYRGKTDAKASDLPSSDKKTRQLEGPVQTTSTPCFHAVRATYSILVNPREIPFDPAEQPLRAVEPQQDVRGVVGLPLEISWPVVGGIEPYEFDKRGKLPSGLRFDKKTGIIRGSPEKPGTYDVDLQVKDAQTHAGDWRSARRLRGELGSPYVEGMLSFRIVPRGRLRAKLLLPPYARVGSDPKLVVWVQGGIGQKKFEGLSLPSGLKIDAITGEISGTLTAIGTYNLAVRITDENPYPDEHTMTLTAESWKVIPRKPNPGFINTGTGTR